MTIKFELNRDPLLLEQYYRLREECFRKELGLPEFDGSEEERDRHGHIILAYQGDRCIGGARIAPDVPLDIQFQELSLHPNACCMWERFVMDPAVRTVQLIRDFISHLIEISRTLGYRYAYLLSSQRNARFYRQCHSALGVRFMIHGNVPDYAQGAFAGLEHYLSVSHLEEPLAVCLVA